MGKKKLRFVYAIPVILIAAIATIVPILKNENNTTEIITEDGNLYPLTAKIIAINYNKDLVTIETANGNQFQFYGVEDYITNDIVSLIMTDKGTEEIADDEIISVRYAGYVSKNFR